MTTTSACPVGGRGLVASFDDHVAAGIGNQGGERSIAVNVDDVGETYQRAVAVGAGTVEAPTDQFYGDRRAMVRDRFGNLYQIAPPIES